MLSNLRLYKGGKEQKDCDDTTSESVSSKAQKNWPRKGFQTNEDEGVESAMMCSENLDDSEQEKQTKKRLAEMKIQTMTRKSKTMQKPTKNMSKV